MFQLKTVSTIITTIKRLQKPYSCNYASCAKRYTDPSSLRKHLRAHKRAGQPETVTGAALVRTGSEEEEEEEEGEGAGEMVGTSVICPADFNPDTLLQSVGCDEQEGVVVSYADEFDQIGVAHGHESSLWADSGELLAPGRAGWTEQQQQHQDSHFSRSWCAGSTTDWLRQQGVRATSQPVNGNHAAKSASRCPSLSSSNCVSCGGNQLPLGHQHQVLGRSLPATCRGGRVSGLAGNKLASQENVGGGGGWRNVADSSSQACCQNNNTNTTDTTSRRAD